MTSPATRSAAVVALVAALGASGCGAKHWSPAQMPPPPREFQVINGTLPASANLRSPNVCGRGDDACITAVVGEMRRRLRILASRCDHNAAFALLYMRVTGNVSGTPFLSRAFLNHLDATFAKFYFRSFDAWYRGERERVPEVWRITFEAADKRSTTGFGDMLLGMNAHISRDLTFTLVQTGLKTPDGRSAEPDYKQVDRLLAGVAPSILREESRRFDPTVGQQVFPLARTGLLNLAEIGAQWRAEAWRNAERILGARGAARRRLEQAVNDDAAGRARLIVSLTSNLVVGPGTQARDRFCRTHHGVL